MIGQRTPHRTERGVALIVALVFLIVLSLLGVSATTNNTLQEQMAGNTRNRDVAFEAAEHAMESADKWLKDNAASLDSLAVSAGDRVLNNGESHTNDAAYWLNSFDWTASGLGEASITGPYSDPLYVIEKMPDAGGKPYYRVTVRGIGATPDAVVILQAMYVITN